MIIADFLLIFLKKKLLINEIYIDINQGEKRKDKKKISPLIELYNSIRGLIVIGWKVNDNKTKERSSLINSLNVCHFIMF